MEPPIQTQAAQDAARLTGSFREFLGKHQTEIAALKILSDLRNRQRLTEAMLKELRKALLTENPAWNEDSLWQAYAMVAPGNVKGCSSEERFADLVPLVRFSLEQQALLEPFAESTRDRFSGWVARKHSPLTRDQRAWLEMIRDHIGKSLSIGEEDLERTPFTQRGGLKKAQRIFGKGLPKLLEELNAVLAA